MFIIKLNIFEYNSGIIFSLRLTATESLKHKWVKRRPQYYPSKSKPNTNDEFQFHPVALESVSKHKSCQINSMIIYFVLIILLNRHPRRPTTKKKTWNILVIVGTIVLRMYLIPIIKWLHQLQQRLTVCWQVIAVTNWQVKVKFYVQSRKEWYLFWSWDWTCFGFPTKRYTE